MTVFEARQKLERMPNQMADVEVIPGGLDRDKGLYRSAVSYLGEALMDNEHMREVIRRDMERYPDNVEMHKRRMHKTLVERQTLEYLLQCLEVLHE